MAALDLRLILESGTVFRIFKKILEKKVGVETFLSHAGILPGDKVLDIGCGLGDVLSYLPAVEYYGIDISERYIDFAKKKYRHSGSFSCIDISSFTLSLPSGVNISKLKSVLLNCSKYSSLLIPLIVINYYFPIQLSKTSLTIVF